MNRVDFVVFGEAKPAGSKRGFVNPKNGRVMITDVTGQPGKDWRGDVQWEALKVLGRDGEREPWTGAVEMELMFYRTRPKSHYRSGRNAHLVRDAAPAYPTVTPDIDKVERAILDALTGIAYVDDRQVVGLHSRQRWTTGPSRCEITALELPFRTMGDLPETLQQEVR